MKFEEALLELRKGKKIECVDFQRYQIHLSELNEISITFPPGLSGFSAVEFIIKGEWKVVEERGKTFDQVFESFKEGKKIRRKSWDKYHYMKLHSIESCYCDIVDLIENDWEVIE